MSWQALSDDVFELGESPFWHPTEQQLYWVDIPGKAILRANIYMGFVQRWDMPSEPGCIAPAAKGGLVIALRDGVFRAQEWGGELECIATLPYDTAVIRANDGKCDALGRFWVGTIDEPKAGRAAELFSVDCRTGSATVQRHAGDALTANGLAWSPDNRTVFWSDTPNHLTHAWDYDLASNLLSAHRVWRTYEPKPAGWTFENTDYAGRPDGAAVDVEGNYYAAMFEGRRICKFAADGSLLDSWETPAQCPTMPCFGGEDLKTLYITTARHGRSAAELTQFPLSGAVFFMRVDVAGLPVHFFAD
ncbi:L-arabinolactonase [Curvibacter sp. AEP1-3]|uniref:SMP-30/gluconolactonase/LRE family protein n=1 Tax=Curvibacter sp. AEP1-3 TaxID=1844971 RepID=UPI000B3D479A|nr:SMP-30/gluconolactonase/LRE family protein [Curvibacter sp. AEP1-3]ARV19280.1 L-arabinolactonase [Curvibacter sp. AEP1-3]